VSIRKGALPIQFSGGVELRQDPKQVPTSKLLDLQNAVFTRQTTLSKRNGYIALSTQIQDGGGDYTNARGLAVRDSERLLFTDKRCYSYRPSNDRWADTGEVAATTATTLPIARTGTMQTQPDIADRNGVRVVAWEDSRGGVWISIIESQTDRILRSQYQLDSSSSARSPRCIAVGEQIHVIWTRGDLNQLQICVINPASPTATPVVAALTGDLDPLQPFYDALATPNGASGAFDQRPGLIAWAQIGGGFRVAWLAPGGVLGGPATALPSVATYADILAGPIAVAWDGVFGIVAVIWGGTGGVLRARFISGASLTTVFRDVTGPALVAAKVIADFGAADSSGAPVLYWAVEVTAARTDLTSVVSGRMFQNDTTTDLLSTTLLGHGLVSRAWHDGATLLPDDSVNLADGDVYVMVAHTVRYFPYIAALRISGSSAVPIIVSRLLPGEAAGALMRPTGAGTRAWTQHLPSVLSIDLDETNLYSRQHAVCLPYRIQLSSQNGDQFSEQGIKLATLNFDVRYQTAQLGRGLYLASSAPMHYDGDAWHEADFHCAPDYGYNAAGAAVNMSAAVTMVAGGSVANGTYLYRWWYEAVDAQGELHRGPTSVPLLVTMTGGPRSLTMDIPTCRMTRFPVVYVCVARSVAGATGTDSTLPLYRVTSTDITVTAGSNRFVLNDPTVSTVTFVDGLADADVLLREPLYTNGGILSNAPASWGGSIIAASKSRLFWNDTTDPYLVRYSQSIADDTALEAPVDLSLSVDPSGGPITAIGGLDDTIIVFKETETYVFGGPGPLADPSAGAEANAFTSAERVTSDVGCLSSASIGQTPAGITFQSRKGIKLLSRQRQVIDIGNPVEPLGTQNFTRTTLLPDRKSILYLTDTADGFSLYWDYDRDQWSKFSNHLGLDAVVVDGIYHYLRTDGRVFQETPGVYRDDNSRIPLRIETAWIHVAQYLQGWQKILWAYFLGSYQSPHTLSVRWRLDYGEAYYPAVLCDVNANYDPSLYGAGAYGAGAYGGPQSGGTRYQRRIHINRRCQSVSFLIEDIEAYGDFGASFELSELLLIGGGLGPDFKIGASRSS
jgi:hypothetical protein